VYRAQFYVGGDLVMTLEIEGETRIEILKNIIQSQWTQQGFFVIEDHEIDDIIMNLVGGLNSSSDDYLDDNKWQEYLYKLKTHLELGLDLRKFLSDGNKEINSMDIFKRFCSEIKDEFEMSNDTLNISYNTERI
jgi:hypothetical protein